MLKTIFLLAGVLVIVIIVCLIDISSIFLDEGTARLLYSDDSLDKSENHEDHDGLEQQDREQATTNGKPETDLAAEIASQFGQMISIESEEACNSNENNDVIDLQATLNNLDKQIRSNQAVGVAPGDIQEVANEFANEIIEEWQG